jgi:hypothetical protein
VPVLNPWSDPDHIALAHDLHRTAPQLYSARSLGYDQHRAKRMSVPGRAGTWLKRHSPATGSRRGARIE